MTEQVENDTLTVEIAEDGVIVVHGDIDIAGGPVLDEALVRSEEGLPIVLNLSDVYFIDSSGLRSLLGASRRASDNGATVVLRNVGAEVLRLLQITGTTEHFSIETGHD